MDFGLTATIGAFILLVGFLALAVALVEAGAILAEMQDKEGDDA